jgi:hypothetical protein
VFEYPRETVGFIAGEMGELSDLGALERLVDTLFFASMTIEEGEPVPVAIVYDPRGAAGLADILDETPNRLGQHHAWDVTEIPRREFDVPTLAKLARGIEYGSQLVVVGGEGSSLWIDGIARVARRTDGGRALRIAAPQPGMLVFERRTDQLLRYERGTRTTRHMDVIGRRGPVRRALTTAFRGLVVEFDAPDEGRHQDGRTYYTDAESALIRLIRKMRRTRSGAILALLAKEPPKEVLDGVRYGRLNPMQLAGAVQDDYARIARFASPDWDSGGRSETELARDDQDAADQLDVALDDVAQLSAIDGAVLAGPQLAIYGAGYLVPLVQLGPATVRRALDTTGESWEPYKARSGARHAAAISFAFDNEDAVAFVVSEDGPVSCAHRVGEHVYVWPVEILET